jgi:hypothetical protein
MLFFLRDEQNAKVSRPETLIQRVVRLIDEAVASGRFQSRAKAILAAGLTTGWLSERIAQDEASEDGVGLRASTLAKLSEALGIPVATILGADPLDPPLVDKYPERAWAITAARALNYPEAAIQRVLSEDPGGEPPRIYWFRRIESEAERMRPASDG